MIFRRTGGLVIVVLVLGGCGAGAGEDKAASPEGCGPPESGNGVAVCMKDVKYLPMEVKVPAGGRVVWTNADQIPHTVTKESGPGPDFDSEIVNAGDTYEQAFPVAGRVPYVCTIHPNQRGTVVVE